MRPVKGSCPPRCETPSRTWGRTDQELLPSKAGTGEPMRFEEPLVGAEKGGEKERVIPRTWGGGGRGSIEPMG